MQVDNSPRKNVGTQIHRRGAEARGARHEREENEVPGQGMQTLLQACRLFTLFTLSRCSRCSRFPAPKVPGRFWDLGTLK